LSISPEPVGYSALGPNLCTWYQSMAGDVILPVYIFIQQGIESMQILFPLPVGCMTIVSCPLWDCEKLLLFGMIWKQASESREWLVFTFLKGLDSDIALWTEQHAKELCA